MDPAWSSPEASTHHRSSRDVGASAIRATPGGGTRCNADGFGAGTIETFCRSGIADHDVGGAGADETDGVVEIEVGAVDQDACGQTCGDALVPPTGFEPASPP